MIRRQTEEQLAERIVDRISNTNAKILEKIGKAIKQISTLTPTQAHQLAQILKYGGSYNEIANELAKESGKNLKEIYKIFEEVAKTNKFFAKEFYQYRGMEFLPYEKDLALQRQVRSIADITANTFINISKTTMIGLVQDGQVKSLQQAYYDTIDKAVLSVSQGKEDFYTAMRDTIKELGGNGLVEYKSGYKRRLDSAVRQNLYDGIRRVQKETNFRFSQEYGADGVEISVHINPAPDHADTQGRQFSMAEYNKLQTTGYAEDTKGRKHNLHLKLKSGNEVTDFRPIEELNCYHKPLYIILGISKPQYTDEQLKQIKEDNEKGFEFEGKHYTNYEGTQLQRRIETEIRKQKDTQILAKASGDMELVRESQDKISLLTKKYNDLSKASGLKTKKERMTVSGYKRIAVNKKKPIKEVVQQPAKPTDEELNEMFMLTTRDLEDKNIEVDNSIYNIPDKELRNRQIEQLDNLTNKYPADVADTARLKLSNIKLSNRKFAQASYYDKEIKLNSEWFNDKQKYIDKEKECIEKGWHYKVPADKVDIYTITHEYGHIVEYQYYKWLQHRGRGNISYHEADTDLRDIIMHDAMRKLGKKMTITEFKKKYWSGYATSKRHSEWFAETFAKYNLSDEQDVWTQAFGEWLEEFYK